MYTTQSYRQSKQREYEELKKVREDKAKEDKAENEKTNDNDNIEVAVDPQEVDLTNGIEEVQHPGLAPEIVERDWFTHKKSGFVLLRVMVINREKRKVKIQLKLEAADDEEDLNVSLPNSIIKESFYDADTKCVLHLQKIDPLKPFGKIKITLVTKALDVIPKAPGYFSNAEPKNFVQVPLIKNVGVVMGPH